MNFAKVSHDDIFLSNVREINLKYEKVLAFSCYLEKACSIIGRKLYNCFINLTYPEIIKLLNDCINNGKLFNIYNGEKIKKSIKEVFLEKQRNTIEFKVKTIDEQLISVFKISEEFYDDKKQVKSILTFIQIFYSYCNIQQILFVYKLFKNKVSKEFIIYEKIQNHW